MTRLEAFAGSVADAAVLPVAPGGDTVLVLSAVARNPGAGWAHRPDHAIFGSVPRFANLRARPSTSQAFAGSF